jgi:hypothetical protein
MSDGIVENNSQVSNKWRLTAGCETNRGRPGRSLTEIRRKESQWDYDKSLIKKVS